MFNNFPRYIIRNSSGKSCRASRKVAICAPTGLKALLFTNQVLTGRVVIGHWNPKNPGQSIKKTSTCWKLQHPQQLNRQSSQEAQPQSAEHQLVDCQLIFIWIHEERSSSRVKFGEWLMSVNGEFSHKLSIKWLPVSRFHSCPNFEVGNVYLNTWLLLVCCLIFHW